jgi:hypothetical protein
MKMNEGQLALVAVLVLSVFGFSATVYAQNNNVDLKVGDVIVANGSGTGSYQVYGAQTYNLKGTLQNGSGTTKGCGGDSTYHIFTADLSTVKRWNINSVPTNQPAVPNKVIQTLSAAGQSVAFDGLGNTYVGQNGGNGCVKEFAPNGSSQYLPLSCNAPTNSSISNGTRWIDLKSDASVIYFTNENSNSINQFSPSCANSVSKCVSTFASISPGNTKLFALRVLTPDAMANTPGQAGYLLVAAGPKIVLLNSSGSVIQTYTASGETDFEALTFSADGTSFVAGGPSTGNLYSFAWGSVVGGSTSGLNVAGAGTGNLNGLCTYGLADAAQPQPLPANVLSCADSSPGAAVVAPAPPVTCPGGIGGIFTSNTAAFNLPGNDDSSRLKATVNFNPGAVSGNVTARVTKIKSAAGASDPTVSSSTNGVSEGGSFACTTDASTNTCYVWEIETDLDFSTFSADDASVTQANGNVSTGTTRILKNESFDITSYSGNQDPAGPTKFSVYSLNEFVQTVPNEVVCSTPNGGYLSPVVEAQVYKFGSVVPFKFQVAASQADCASNNFLTNLGNNAYLALVDASTVTTTTQSPHTVTFSDTAAGSSAAPFYRLSTNQYIQNVDSGSLQPSHCYIATTFANQIQSFTNPSALTKPTFCLTQ